MTSERLYTLEDEDRAAEYDVCPVYEYDEPCAGDMITPAHAGGIDVVEVHVVNVRHLDSRGEVTDEVKGYKGSSLHKTAMDLLNKFPEVREEMVEDRINHMEAIADPWNC